MPAFRRDDPAMTSGPTSGTMEMSAARVIGESGAQVRATQRPARARAFERPDGVGRAARRGDADEHVRRADAALVDVESAGLGVVFRGFDGAVARLVAAGDDALHEFGRDAEGRRALRGVEHAEPARRPRADVEESAAPPQALHYCLDGARHLREHEPHGLRHARVLLVHQTDDLRGRQAADLARARVLLLRDGDVRVEVFGHC